MRKIIENKKIILIIGGIVFLILSFILYLVNDKKEIEDDIALNITNENITTNTGVKESFYVDVKGSIKKPGVYEIYKNQTIQDVLNKAGGLKKDSYTDNINLSKIVSDEMVIYIHSKKEIEKIKELNNCNCNPIITYKECDNLSEEKNEEEIKEIIITNTNSTTTITEPITSKMTTTKTTITTQEEITTKEVITTNIVESSKDTKININTCTIDDLIGLKGLGESKAKSIIEYKNTNGSFKTIEEILNVKGIGSKIFESIKDFIEV